MNEPTKPTKLPGEQNAGDPMDGCPELVLAHLKECCRSWEPGARVIGNARACDILTALERPLADLESFARRFGWDGLGQFSRWLELRMVGAQSLEQERVAVGESKAQFTRWWMGHREETMHQWMRENAPADVRTAYFSITANGSAEFTPAESKHLEVRRASGKVAEALLEAADEAITRAQTLRSDLEEMRKREATNDDTFRLLAERHSALTDLLDFVVEQVKQAAEFKDDASTGQKITDAPRSLLYGVLNEITRARAPRQEGDAK